jgi:hypothetical protein
MSTALETTLAGFSEEAITVKICRQLFTSLPGAPAFVLYADLGGALRRLGLADTDEVVDRVRLAAEEPSTAQALRVASALDQADAGLAVFAGMTNVLSFFASGPRRRTFESDPQQAIDAALKLLGVAYMGAKLFPGTAEEKAAALMALPSGREAALYFATAEVALPFADNVVGAGAGVLSQLARVASGDAGRRFAQYMGGTAAAEASGVAAALQSPLEGLLSQVKGSAGAVSQAVRGLLPRALSVADSVAGAAASGLDVLPCWTFLGARLTAEATASRAAAP